MRSLACIALLAACLSAQICTAGTDTYCRACGTTSCSYCVNSYLGANGACTAVTSNTVQYCVSYSSATVCSACASGYYLTDAKACAKLSDNCVAGTSATVCTVCASGYILNASNACISGSCPTANCNWCSVAGICSLCNNNYVLNAVGACISTPASVSNCITVVDATSTTCLICASGYYKNSSGGCTYSANAVTSVKIVGAALSILVALFMN